MLTWEDRPTEVANLLNPAFCGEVLRRCAKSYETQTSQHLPYPLVFLVLPILLHGRTRSLISKPERRNLRAWLHAHPDTKVGFADRARSLVPVTREAISFLLHTGAAEIDEYGGISTTQRIRRVGSVQIGGDVADCYAKADVVARWFARAGTTETIYAMWGVKP